MILKLAKKKEINEDVLRMIIQYGLGFASRVKNLENKEIEDWKEDKLYEKGAKVLYNNYLWVAKVTNQSSTWNENYWEKIGDDLELIDLDTIKTMLGLTTDELQTLSSIILDSEVRLDKTWSSSKIYTDLQQCLSDSKTFTLNQFAKASKASYQVVSATSEMTDKSVIYLMPNSTNYDMYIVESDGTPTKIGDTTIDLSQFYTKTEIDNNFVKKTDADGKYATITTVDGKVDKTSILSAISSTPSDDKLLSEKAVNDTLVKKTDITTTIDSTSTDSEIATAKAVNDLLQTESPGNLTIPLNEDLNNLIYNRTKVWMNSKTVEIATFTNMPSGRFTECAVIFIPYGNDTSDYGEQILVGNNRIFIRNKVDTTWTSWQRVCTTSVANVPKTKIVFSDTTNYEVYNPDITIYEVVNGICYLQADVKVKNKSLTYNKVLDGIPIPKSQKNGMGSAWNSNNNNANLLFEIRNGALFLAYGETSQHHLINIAYPVENS